MSSRDFAGSPVVKASPSNTAGAGLIPGWGAKVPDGWWLKKKKTENRKNIVTNSIKTLKMDHQKKILKR